MYGHAGLGYFCRIVRVSNLHLIRTAVHLTLVAALAIQPAAVADWTDRCSTSEESSSAHQGYGCCEPDHCSCRSHGEPEAIASGEDDCCGQAKAAEISRRKPGLLQDAASAHSHGVVSRRCSCGQLSQPLSDSTPRSNIGDKRVETVDALAGFVAAANRGHVRAPGRVGVDQPPSPEHFSQRNLCIWRI